MAKTIDSKKLKDAAERLEWVLHQYPDSDEVARLLTSLSALIEDAKAGRVLVPINGSDVPGAYDFTDGRFIPYREPNVDNAYSDFVDEIEGGLSEEDKERIARMDAMRQAMSDSDPTTIN